MSDYRRKRCQNFMWRQTGNPIIINNKDRKRGQHHEKDSKKCGEIIESTSRHDFKFCKCGAVAVDGGKDYLRRVGSKEDYEELVEYEGSDDDEE